MVATELIDAGYDILLEPPVHPDEIAQLMKHACAVKRKIMVSNLYARLPHVTAFVRALAAVRKTQRLSLIEVTASSHVSFYVADVLGIVLPGNVLRVNTIAAEGPFLHVVSRLGQVPLSLRIYNEVDDETPDAYSHAIMRIDAHTAAGTLRLDEACGPLLWLPRMETIGYGDDGLPKAHPRLHPIECLIQEDRRDYAAWMTEEWTQALARNVWDLADANEDNRHIVATLLHARNWSTITKALGYPISVHEQRGEGVPVDGLKEAIGSLRMVGHG